MAFLTSSDKALWHLALPMIFSNITVPLLGLVDTAVIGHLDSPVYLGGVAVGATATSFLFSENHNKLQDHQEDQKIK